MILFQMHIMWYESKMINETLDSIEQALDAYPLAEVKLHFAINLQTYIETPIEDSPENIIKCFIDHPIFSRSNVHITYLTNDRPFYNIADWRREEYDIDAKYTVWGESDCLLPIDFFYILSTFHKSERHILTFASRPMWDDSWEVVTHKALKGFSKPCRCDKEHRGDCIELLEPPFKYKDRITQSELDNFNQKYDINLIEVPLKIDGSLLCISGGMNFKFIARGMHFVREDTCAERVFSYYNVPQIVVITRLKGHNYKHPLKRLYTNVSRDNKIFKKYAEESVNSMNKFLSEIINK